AFEIDRDQAFPDQLTEYRTPLFFIDVPADAESRLQMVTEMFEPLRGFSRQHVDQIIDSESLTGPVNTGQSLLGRHRAVPSRNRLQTGIAIAAAFGQVIAEIAQQGFTTAADFLAQRQHR